MNIQTIWIDAEMTYRSERDGCFFKPNLAVYIDRNPVNFMSVKGKTFRIIQISCTRIELEEVK